MWPFKRRTKQVYKRTIVNLTGPGFVAGLSMPK